MTPTVEEPPVRIYVLRFNDGSESEIRANVICPPSEERETYRLKLDGQIVGEYQKDEVRGWHIKSPPPPMSARIV